MSFSPSFAPKCAFVLLSAVLVGCGGPDDGSRSHQAACAAYEARDLKKAAQLFEQTLTVAPGNVEAMVGLARARLDLGDLAAARKAVDRAAELAGNDADVRLLSAQIAWHAKDYAQACKAFAALADDAKLDAETRAQGWNGVGVVEMSRDNYDLARVAFLKAVRLDRRNAAAWYHLGLLYRDGFGYHEAALEQLSIYVRLDAVASPRVQKVQRTIIPELRGMISQTAAARPGAASRDSAASAAAITKAEAAWKKNSFKTARKLYQDALKADPLSYPAALGLAQAILKADGSAAGQRQALSAYCHACSLRAGAVSTFLTAGDLALRLGQPNAIEIFSRAVAANPTSLPALDGLIKALRKKGNNTAAKAYQGYRDLLAARK